MHIKYFHAQKNIYDSKDLYVVNRGEVVPSLRNNKFDHDVTSWLIDTHWFILLVASVRRNLLWFANRLKSISICCLAALNWHASDSCANEVNLVYNLCTLELNRQLLREHSRCQPERAIVPKNNQWLMIIRQQYVSVCLLSIFKNFLLPCVSRTVIFK